MWNLRERETTSKGSFVRAMSLFGWVKAVFASRHPEDAPTHGINVCVLMTYKSAAGYFFNSSARMRKAGIKNDVIRASWIKRYVGLVSRRDGSIRVELARILIWLSEVADPFLGVHRNSFRFIHLFLTIPASFKMAIPICLSYQRLERNHGA